MARNINSPGVEIKERDLSLRIENPVGTSVVVPGFAAQGPSSEPLTITSISEFETIYGIPTTPAERYFYYSCKEILNSPAVLTTIRLPYGASTGADFTASYSALFYPMLSTGTLDNADWKIGAPVYITLNPSEYDSLIQGNFDWTNPNANAVYTTVNTVILSSVTYTNATSADGLTFALVHDHDNQGVDISYLNSTDTTFTFSMTANVVVPTFGTTTTSTITSTVVSVSSVTYTNATSADGLAFAISNDSDGQNITIFHPTSADTTFVFSITSNAVSTVTLSSSLVNNSAGNVSTAAGFIILNDLQTVINEGAEGYYVGFADNSAVFGNSPDFNSIGSIITLSSTNSYAPIAKNRLDFALSATKLAADRGQDSVSESLEKVGFIGFEKADYQDQISLGVFKIRKSTSDATKLALASNEKYLGSFDFNRKQVSPAGGILANSFIEDVINNNSSTIKMLINPAISRVFDWTVNSSIPTSRVTVDESAKCIFPIGVYTPDTRVTETTKAIGLVPAKLEKVLRLIENPEDTIVDVIIDAGLSTIYSTTQYAGTSSFEDSAYVGTGVTGITNIEDDWRTVVNVLINFSENTRKDCFTIIDAPRSVFISGKDSKVIEGADSNFTMDIYNPLKQCVDKIETNYAAIYANWVKVPDIFTGRRMWLPFSGYAAAVFGRSDATANAWAAPAGFNRGGFLNALDIAFNPNQKQRDRLYEIATNPVAFFSGDGFVVFGQKTLQNKPTAFDRINVRRLFLVLERAVKRTIKYFVFEPNTDFTRTRVKSTITPVFDFAKKTEGVYDFLIVADERNNTPDVIDRNEMVVDIYLKPVRTAEFILVNFIATRTGQNFQELL